ncbi:hypothetical protein AVEN_137467-1 [Araneus ventricosus]|uniref:Uncharacterized protein n=1 Tax=Araneus ventricosus TaxID=182803 RepID=A0A4Y2RH03_ARAVE|nr:hypothetical protein AVEN_137467-1 [Araneus ventricosus]
MAASGRSRVGGCDVTCIRSIKSLEPSFDVLIVREYGVRHYESKSGKYQELSRGYYMTSLPLGEGIKAGFQTKSGSVGLWSPVEVGELMSGIENAEIEIYW